MQQHPLLVLGIKRSTVIEDKYGKEDKSNNNNILFQPAAVDVVPFAVSLALDRDTLLVASKHLWPPASHCIYTWWVYSVDSFNLSAAYTQTHTHS